MRNITTASFIFSMYLIFFSLDSYSQCYELVWSDEFNYSGLPDSTKWGYDVGGGGWGNNELQYYTDARLENAEVKDGKLVIKAKKEAYVNNEYTSARLVSKNRGDWKYGKFEIKAKLPGGRGLWPAIWMLPTDWEYGGWPNSGEIDIMEYVGYDPGVVHGTVHTGSFNHSMNTQKGASITIESAEDSFHIYALEWTEELINIYVDSTKYFTFKNKEDYTFKEWPFDKRFHLLLNVAVGGNWGGAEGVDENVFPQQMEVDYVRVYSDPAINKISGKNEVIKNESNLEYSVFPFDGASYSWTVPDGATFVGKSDSNSVVINWGCEAGDIMCTVQSTCASTDLKFPVGVVQSTISGDIAFNEVETDKTFSVIPTSAISMNWEIPGDAVISSGQGTEEIAVKWGSQKGDVTLIQENLCGIDTLSLYVYGIGKFAYPNPASPHMIPGEINPVEYDYGGEGVAYHDADIDNQGDGKRQDEAVDTQMSDNGNDNLGWISAGEWVDYSISVEKEGEYFLSIRTTSQISSNRGPISVSVNGENRIEAMEIPFNGSWTDFDWLPTKPLALFATDTVLRISVGNGNFNIGTIKIEDYNFIVDVGKIINSVKIYPNPTNRILHVNSEKKIIGIKVFDVAGILIMEKKVDYSYPEIIINTDNFDRGIYFLQLKMQSGKINQSKFVKK